jgi:pimeloyl-ACP methyl ester carboxylesterase
MEVESGYAKVNGTRLFYEVAGSGRPVVFIHGHVLDRRMWDDQFEVFARRYRVIRYDMRGYGRSALPMGAPYYTVEDLKALLDYLGVARAYVIGLSKGGVVAIDFALTYPEATAAVVAVDAGLTGYSLDATYRAGLEQVTRAAQAEGLAAAREATLRRPSFELADAIPSVSPRLRRIVHDHPGYFWLNPPGEELRPSPPAATRLDTIRAPLLSIVGERDAPDFHKIGDLLAEKAPNARKVVIPGAGHLSNMERPEAVNEALRRFLAEVDGMPAGAA